MSEKAPPQESLSSKGDSSRPPRHLTDRSSKISTRSIELTHEDPLDRLQQLCSQGLYRYQPSWDKFSNGIMYEIELTYQLNSSPSSKRVVIKEARFVPGSDVQYAQKVVAATLLERLGLGVTEEVNVEEDETRQKMQEIAEKGMSLVMASLDSMLAGVTEVKDQTESD